MSDNELNALVATKIMGWEELEVGYFGSEWETPRQVELRGWMEKVDINAVGSYWIDVERDWWSNANWQPTLDIAQAWQVVERMRELGFVFELQYGDIHPLGQDVFASFDSSETQGVWEDDSPAKAIAIAALKALGVEVQA